MRFLVDEDMPRRTGELLRRYGHEATDVRDIGLGGAADERIAQYAQEHGLCLITGDLGFGDVRNYPPESYAGIMVLELPRDATARTILSLLESLLRRPDVMERLVGQLAVVAFGRVRLRPGAQEGP